MKTTLLLLLSLSTFAGYYSDHPEVQQLVLSGQHTLDIDSSECPQRFGSRELTDSISKKICVKNIDIPSDVMAEVSQMKMEELDNESDYDQRITELRQFKWRRFRSSEISMYEIRELMEAFSIDSDFLNEMSFSATNVDESTFSRFEGLFLGYDYVEKTKTYEFIQKEFLGQDVMVVEMTKESSLYPGGGFNVTHTFIISSNKVMFVKLSWWNS